MNRCRLCGEPCVEERLHLPNSPRNISKLLRKEDLDGDHPVELTVYECRVCGFVQLLSDLGETFYDDYLMGTSFSPQMVEYQETLASEFVHRYGLAGKRVIEVGCGDGSFLQGLQNAGAIVGGLEPSERFRSIATSRGFEVFPAYVEGLQPLPGAPYDGFVARQVLEHVKDINDFLRTLHRSLRPGGVGLVEVPSLETAQEDGRFYDFFADHLNYFSVRTLATALERCGFSVIEVLRGMGREYNLAYVRAGDLESFGLLRRSLESLTAELRIYIQNRTAAGQRVAVWGSGGKGVAALALSRVEGLAYVVDSDSRKHGLYAPVSHLPVSPPERLVSEPVGAVIVTALAYKEEILRQLRDVIRFRGQIALLGPHLEILDKGFPS